MSNVTSRAGHGPHRDPDKEKFWREMLKAQAGSGQTVREFCHARGLTEPAFYAWRRTIAQRDRKGASPRSTRPTFVELRPKFSPHAAEAPLEVVAGDRRVLIRPGCDRELLRDVLAALGD